MRKVYITIIILIILGVAGYLLFGKSDNKSTNSSTTTTNTATTTSSSNSAKNSQTSKTWNISIKDMAFEQTTLIVSKGTKVTWTNNDSVAHTVTGDNGGPSSDTIDPGKSYSFTFDKAGSFNYHCSFHSSMVGSVTVQ